MKTIVEALQDLYVAMGGEQSDVSGLSLNPDVIEQIASLVQSGGTKELPAVTAADNDKVLAVVNGAWDKAEASGGGGGGDNVYTFDLWLDTELSGVQYTNPDITSLDEIMAAWNAGKTVKCILKEEYAGQTYVQLEAIITAYTDTNGYDSLTFVEGSGNSVNIGSISYYDEDHGVGANILALGQE